MSVRTSILPRNGTFDQLLDLAILICRQAGSLTPRAGPGARPLYPDWILAVLIALAVAHRRKTKNAQYQFLLEHREPLCRRLGLKRFPARSTYFERYRRVHRLLNMAIQLEGQLAIQRGWAPAEAVAVDRSLIEARGPRWSQAKRKHGKRPPPGFDAEATWSYSEYHGWVHGYGYEVVVTAGEQGPVWPLLASADAANVREHRSFPVKVSKLPDCTRYVLADCGYDSNDLGEAVEWDGDGRPSGRLMVCPQQVRYHKNPPKQQWRETRRRRDRRQKRQQRRAFYESPEGRTIYTRRSRTVEPFNSWFKSLFELDSHAWHRGLDNNRTQILAGILVYQLLLQCKAQQGQPNGQIKCLLDRL